MSAFSGEPCEVSQKEFLFAVWSYEITMQLGKIFWDWVTELEPTFFYREAKGFKHSKSMQINNIQQTPINTI